MGRAIVSRWLLPLIAVGLVGCVAAPQANWPARGTNPAPVITPVAKAPTTPTARPPTPSTVAAKSVVVPPRPAPTKPVAKPAPTMVASAVNTKALAPATLSAPGATVPAPLPAQPTPPAATQSAPPAAAPPAAAPPAAAPPAAAPPAAAPPVAQTTDLALELSPALGMVPVGPEGIPDAPGELADTPIVESAPTTPDLPPDAVLLPERASDRFVQSGMASWYGPGFHGKKTANGERFNTRSMTAAHRTLAFGTMLRVTNLANQRSVVVRVNDRGPYSRGRILDVSHAAAELLGMTHTGVARVTIEKVTANNERDYTAPDTPSLWLELGEFDSTEAALPLQRRVADLGYNNTEFLLRSTPEGDAAVTVLRLGPYASAAAQETSRLALEGAGIPAVPALP